MPPGTPTGASCPKHFQPHTRADRGQTHETRVSRPRCVGHGSASRRTGRAARTPTARSGRARRPDSWPAPHRRPRPGGPEPFPVRPDDALLRSAALTGADVVVVGAAATRDRSAAEDWRSTTARRPVRTGPNRGRHRSRPAPAHRRGPPAGGGRHLTPAGRAGPAQGGPRTAPPDRCRGRGDDDRADQDGGPAGTGRPF